MRKILIFYNSWNEQCITGGQFYEENMYQCFLENPQFEVDRFCLNRKRTFINKLLSPLLNLKYLKKCLSYNLIIFNSVEGWYFIPLLILIRLFTKSKVAIIHHHFMHLEFSGIKRWIYKNIESTFLRLSNYIVTVSPYVKDLSDTIYPKKNIRIWPIPFSDTIIEVTEDNKKEGALVYIGTIEPRKGLKYLIQALTILKENNTDCHLNIIGKIKDNEYYNDLLQIINQNNLNVSFHGFVEEEIKDQLLKESQIFVFPSLLEGYGMVLREVMSYGLPIVCFNNSAMPYLVKDNVNGKIVKNKDSLAMANAIDSIIKNRNLRDKLSKGAYEFTKQTMTNAKYKIHIANELEAILNG